MPDRPLREVTPADLDDPDTLALVRALTSPPEQTKKGPGGEVEARQPAQGTTTPPKPGRLG